ncbi:MAG: acyltransferase [Nostocaceae cyanobacterium]|nr:acyltransferase [Nostocaceae cyanobacterium]
MDSSPIKSTAQKIRLPYLDGLRGLAALYVVIFHIWLLSDDNFPGLWNHIRKLFRYGELGVVVFIVLSGYCLMLPVSRSQSGFIPGGLWEFFKRRGRRILPPYYAALGFSILLALIILGLQKFTNFHWNDSLGGAAAALFYVNFSFTDVITHLLLIHNFGPEHQIYGINGPMWSVALEWQIYFLLPLLFLPIWRRLGWFWLVIIVFVLGLIPHYLMNGFIDRSHPWFMGAFVMGMLAADISFSDQPHLQWMRKSLPWGVLTILVIILALLAEWQKFGLEKLVNQSILGVATACFLIYCSNFYIDQKRLSPLVQVLQSPFCILLGEFSYSLYLTHAPVLKILANVVHNLQLSQLRMAIIEYVLGISLSLILAYLFYLVFERPTKSSSFWKRKLKGA